VVSSPTANAGPPFGTPRRKMERPVKPDQGSVDV
jgi:hypothetical protein